MRCVNNETGLSVDPVARGSLRQQVTSRLLTMIFQGRFASGERLVVQPLSVLYEVSPTPIRESLVELANLGMVDLLPNRGAVLRPFGPQEVREISQLRRVLEVEAARCACGRIDQEEFSALEQELRRLESLPRGPKWDQAVRAADTRLHSLIASSSGSARLTSEITRYLTLFRTLRDLSHDRDAWTQYSRSNDVPEHLAIVRAIAVNDEPAAGEAMDRHIRSAEEILVEVVFGESVVSHEATNGGGDERRNAEHSAEMQVASSRRAKGSRPTARPTSDAPGTE